jgi:hypothetical protein
MKNYTGSLNVSVNGKQEAHDYDYVQYEDVQDAIDSIGEDAVLKLVNRMSKVDARNAEAAKFNTRTLTEEQKLANKEKARKDRELLAKLKANPELLASLGL